MKSTMKSFIGLIAFTILLFVSGSLQQNYVFDDALTVTSPNSIDIDNSESPDDAVLSLCSELTSASSFLWYKIEASSSLRVFTIDTCDITFDSVIGVFSGSDFNSLNVLGCNDDRASSFAPENALCNPSSSYLQHISVSSGEVLYIVIGAFLDPYTGDASLGLGHLQITEVDPSSLECSADLILQVQQDLEDDLSSLQSSISSSITSSQNQIESFITSSQTAVTNAIDAVEVSLESDIQTVQSTVTSIESTVSSTSTSVSSISTALGVVDDKVDTITSDLSSVNTNINLMGTQIGDLSTATSAKFVTSNTKIDAVQSSADQITTLSNQLITENTAIQSSNDDIVDLLAEFQSDVVDSFTAVDLVVDDVNTNINLVNDNLLIVSDDLDVVDQSILDVSSKISSLSGNVNTLFSNTNVNIDELQSSATAITTLSNQINDNAEDIQDQQTALDSQLDDFQSSVSTSFGTTLDALGTVNSVITASHVASQSSFSDSTALLNTLKTSSDSISSTSSASLTLLNTLENDVNSDVNQIVFVDTLIRYLADKSALNIPLFIRIPNLYGGRMNDASAYVISQYNALKASALLIGSKSSVACTSNLFCNFFLNTADAAYSDSMVKFNTNVNLRKFSIAYSYLQQAFLNLYPTW